MSDQLEPVDWAGVKIAPSGPRHYAGSEANARPIWKCPACGEQNESPLGEGCKACGGGGGATHVGVPPVVVKSDVIVKYHTGQDLKSVETRAVPHTSTTASIAFALWIHRYDTRDFSDDQINLVSAAFEAGWRMAQPTTQGDTPDLELPTVVVSDGTILEGTIQSRTLIAALTFFADQVLKQQPEETDTGEWLKVEQIASLIEEIKVTYGR